MIMGCMLIAPEMVIIWAARQWYAAREIAESQKARGWTITHGFFASMGGFVLYKDGVMAETLEIEELELLELEGKIDWPDISEKDIQDRSKGDSFSKGFAVLQTTWFITQCIARGVAGLNLTELELVTLAFGVLNGILYFLWWNKPLDVRRPVPVHFRRPTVSNPALVAVSHWQPQHPSASDPALVAVSHWQPPRLSAFASFRAYLHKELNNRGWFALIYVFIMRPFQIIWSPLLAMFGPTHTAPAATFYAPTSTSGNPRLIGMAIGILFGGIHCIAWSFDFPSVAEQYIWRISAVSVTALPTIIAVSFKYIQHLGQFTLFPCTALYWVSRSALLILPLLALRSLPTASLLDFNWSAFIPHI